MVKLVFDMTDTKVRLDDLIPQFLTVVSDLPALVGAHGLAFGQLCQTNRHPRVLPFVHPPSSDNMFYSGQNTGQRREYIYALSC